MEKVMYSQIEVQQMIESGKSLILAGSEEQLKQLPMGKWIGGTIPYFMAENGGVFDKTNIFVTELPFFVTDIVIKEYDSTTISNIYQDGFENGFSVVIIPASSQTHLEFALNAPKYEKFASKPLIGWISGVELSLLGKETPKVFSGRFVKSIEDGAIAVHIKLPAEKFADINIVNIFNPGSGDMIHFLEDGFSASDCLINGEKRNFADYIIEKNVDIKLPLVADYSGALLNTSFQEVDNLSRRVNFYAPVFKGVDYKLATPINDYVSQFNREMPSRDLEQIIFSCNCILNYLYSHLEGKQTCGITGPITFGEIAYQLLNQTLVYVTINNIE